MANRVIDLRSDTVTRPTPAMLQAMVEAELGDDVLGDDPTVKRLEARAAAIMGKEAALFVPSGTMGNGIAIKVHTRPGDEILLDWDAHSARYEVGGAAAISGVQTRLFRSHRGVPDSSDIESAIQPKTLHSPGTTLIVLENTHNVAGGTVIPLEIHRGLYSIVGERGIKIHLDGARLFNASIATRVPAAEFASHADSVTFCLSKGLACPVGSVLCGTIEFIAEARRVRKMLGGGMRQAGVLAACGLVALDTMIDRLADDHAKARRLAEGIADLPGLYVDLESVQTNMVFVDVEEGAELWMHKLESECVRCLDFGPNRIRLVTHCDIVSDDIDRTMNAFRRIVTNH